VREAARPTNSYPNIDAEQIHWNELDAVQTDLLVHALACDQTRVFTYRFSPCNDLHRVPRLPTFTIDPTTSNTGTSMHAWTHQDSSSQPNVGTCLLFVMSKLAGLLEKLKATPEGAGNLLDNCGILAWTECTEGRSHNATSAPGIPMLIAGRAGGKLKYPGIHYKSPAQGDTPSETRGAQYELRAADADGCARHRPHHVGRQRGQGHEGDHRAADVAACAGTMTSSGNRAASAAMRVMFSRTCASSSSPSVRCSHGRSSRSVMPSSCHTRSPTNA